MYKKMFFKKKTEIRYHRSFIIRQSLTTKYFDPAVLNP